MDFLVNRTKTEWQTLLVEVSVCSILSSYISQCLNVNILLISNQSICSMVALTVMTTERAVKEVASWKPLVTLKSKAEIGFREIAKVVSESLCLSNVSLWETEVQSPQQQVMCILVFFFFFLWICNYSNIMILLEAQDFFPTPQRE